MLQQAGAAGVKVDFQNWEIQIPTINMINLIEDAAKYNLIVDSHDFNIPVGLERAHPNLITNKFYWGSEWWDFYNLFSSYIPLATHLVRSYYLQAVTGPTDMTPLLLLRLTGPSYADDTYLLRTTTGAIYVGVSVIVFLTSSKHNLISRVHIMLLLQLFQRLVHSCALSNRLG